MIMQPLKFTLINNNDSVTTLLNRNEHGADAPDGFDESHVKYARSEEFYGVFKSFAIPLKFIKGQARLVREMFYSYGIGADMSVTVEKLNKQTLTYFTEYSGKLDFLTFKDSDDFCECNFIDGGLATLIKKDKGTQYDIPDYHNADGVGRVAIKIDSTHYITAIRPIEMGRMLIDKITNQDKDDRDYGIQSYDYEPAITSETLLITSGRSIREFMADPDSVNVHENGIKTSFDDWFKTISALKCSGMTIRGNDAIIGRRLFSSEFFANENQVLCDVGEVSRINIGLIAEWNYRRVKCGYPEKDYADEFRKYYETATTCEWVAQNPTTVNEYDAVSKYRGDMAGIQSIIDTNWGAMDQDDSEDEEIWIVPVEWDSLYRGSVNVFTLNKTALYKINEGVTYGGLILDNTPRRNLLNHVYWLRNCLFKQINVFSEMLKYTSGGNDQINNATFSGEDIVPENEEIGSESPDVFYPLFVEFEAPYPANFTELIEATVPGFEDQLYEGRIGFKYKGVQYYGLIMSVGVKLSDRAAGKYKLCLFANTGKPDYTAIDITQLIR